MSRPPPPPMAEANGSWADIPDNCLVCIVRLLPCILDHAIFSNICRKWRSIAQQHPPRKLPWLLMPSTAATSFFCVAANDTHHRPRLPDDARGARFCGSFPGGWLIAALPQSRGHALLNLFTGVRVRLPSLLLVPGTGGGSKCPMFIHAATLSAAPSAIRPYYAAGIMSGQSNVAFWRPGMNHWAPPMRTTVPSDESWRDMMPKDPIEDMIYYAGTHCEGFHVLTNKENLLVYTPEINDNGALTMFVANYDFPDHLVTTPDQPGQVVARYLVESRGKLLMVVRFVSPEQGTVSFDVFILEHKNVITGTSSSDSGTRVLASWNKTWFSNLSGRRIFAGRGCSVAVDMKNPCPLYIYFLDDAASFHGVQTVTQVENPYPCCDTGRCWFFNQDIVRNLPRGPSSDCSPWIWFFLSDATFRSDMSQPPPAVVSDASDESDTDRAVSATG